jgi:hypothetical protein
LRMTSRRSRSMLTKLTHLKFSRSKELILFKIDESDSKSWNETKTYE